MLKKIIPACDSVYVSEENPRSNYADSGSIDVRCVLSAPASGSAQSRPHPRDTIGLLRFEIPRLPGCELTGARLALFVGGTGSQTSHIRVYPNMEPFDTNAVTWSTRPKIRYTPVADLLVPEKKQGEYVELDVTQMVKSMDAGKGACSFGVTLAMYGRTNNAVAFASHRSEHPPYISVEFSRKRVTFRRCPPHPEAWKNVFCERNFDVHGMDDLLFSKTIEAARARTITFFVKNMGAGSLDFHLQVSPDGIHFLNDKQTLRLEANEMEALTPYLFAKYMRVCLRPVMARECIHAHIWCQMQTLDYMANRPACDSDVPACRIGP